MDLSKRRLTDKEAERFRKHWKKYCKDISPKKAVTFLLQSYPEIEPTEVKDMYWDWRETYLESEEW